MLTYTEYCQIADNHNERLASPAEVVSWTYTIRTLESVRYGSLETTLQFETMYQRLGVINSLQCYGDEFRHKVTIYTSGDGHYAEEYRVIVGQVLRPLMFETLNEQRLKIHWSHPIAAYWRLPDSYRNFHKKQLTNREASLDWVVNGF
jgi:hypothetical protein